MGKNWLLKFRLQHWCCKKLAPLISSGAPWMFVGQCSCSPSAALNSESQIFAAPVLEAKSEEPPLLHQKCKKTTFFAQNMTWRQFFGLLVAPWSPLVRKGGEHIFILPAHCRAIGGTSLVFNNAVTQDLFTYGDRAYNLGFSSSSFLKGHKKPKTAEESTWKLVWRGYWPWESHWWGPQTRTRLARTMSVYHMCLYKAMGKL